MITEERLKELLDKAQDSEVKGYIAGSALYILSLEDKLKSKEQYIKGLENFIKTGKKIEVL